MNAIHRNTSSRYITALLVLAAAYVSAPAVTFAAVIPDPPAPIKDFAAGTDHSPLTGEGNPCQNVEHVIAWNGVTSRSCDTSTSRV